MPILSKQADEGGMGYFETTASKLITLWLPLAAFLFILLFPFYWMAVTTFKGKDELYDYERQSPFWVSNPTLANVKKLLFDTSYPEWLWNTMLVAVVATFLSLTASVLAAYAIERLRFKGPCGLDCGRYVPVGARRPSHIQQAAAPAETRAPS